MDLRKSVDTAIERYGSGVVPQVALSSATAILGVLFAPAAVIPAAAQAAIAARASQIQQERIERARAQAGQQLQKIEAEKVDAAFVESDAFFDWLYEAFDRIRRAQGEAKLEALRNTFINGLLVGQSSSPLKDIVLRRLGELSPHHVRTIQAWAQVARPLEPADNPGVAVLGPGQDTRSFARRDEFRKKTRRFERRRV